MKRKLKFYILTAFVLIIIADRYVWMPNRVKDEIWMYEKGTYVGDPVRYGNDFEIKDSHIIFKQNTTKPEEVNQNRKDSFHFTGCYFGWLFMYNTTSDEMVIYLRKS
ncbi:hypothetical protein ABS768_13710 [Flavobacterium sp. ST-75]|uniref:DKNYY family protein n=1 Tax=Flavobacterium rhizophilum TaxID=3163296 RepID=A0ABW8YGY8_9FLAO